MSEENNPLADDHIIAFTVDNYLQLEKQLSECFEYIPCIEQNKNTISTKFIPIIMESCSIIDSIFRVITTEQKGKMNFKKYALFNENLLNLNDMISIFLVPPIKFYQPYKNWVTKIPVWWYSYNKLKHARLDNYEHATFETALLSLAGLHQLITKCRLFTNHLVKAGWFNPAAEKTGELIVARLGEVGVPMGLLPCESKLFVSPLHQNFVEYDEKNWPWINSDCDFSDRIKVLLSLEPYGY